MPDVQRKSDFLTRIRAEHTQLEDLLSTLSQEQMLRPGVAGSWSVKDVLVHLTWWEQDLIGKIASGEPLDLQAKGDLLAIDHANALIVKARRRTPLTDVLAEFSRSYQHLLYTLEGLTDEDLANDETYNYLVNNTVAHYAEHRVWIDASLRPRRGFSSAALSRKEL